MILIPSNLPTSNVCTFDASFANFSGSDSSIRLHVVKNMRVGFTISSESSPKSRCRHKRGSVLACHSLFRVHRMARVGRSHIDTIWSWISRGNPGKRESASSSHASSSEFHGLLASDAPESLPLWLGVSGSLFRDIVVDLKLEYVVIWIYHVD